MDLSGKTVLITGAARGLGAAMAHSVRSERRERRARRSQMPRDWQPRPKRCTELGVSARSYEANVAKEADVVELFARVVADFGRLDAAINNAGILRDGLLVKAKDGQIVSTLSLERVAGSHRREPDRRLPLRPRSCAAHDRARHAAALSSTSRASRAHGNFGQSNYSAAKAGVAALTVVWAKELARHHIRVNAIAPGFVRTEMVASMRPEVLEKMAATIPLGRLCEPREIAHAAVYLLENDYMTGRVIDIDGGQRL